MLQIEMDKNDLSLEHYKQRKRNNDSSKILCHIGMRIDPSDIVSAPRQETWEWYWTGVKQQIKHKDLATISWWQGNFCNQQI